MAFLKLSDDQRQEASRFVLLDFADLLARYAPLLWAAISARPTPGLAVPVRDAYDLSGQHYADTVSSLLLAGGDPCGLGRAGGDLGRDQPTGQDRRRPVSDNHGPDRSAHRDQPGLADHATAAHTGLPRPQAGPKADDSLRHPLRLPPARAAVHFAPTWSARHRPRSPSRPSSTSTPLPAQCKSPCRSTPRIAGLRKAPRNVSVLVSRELRQQMERVMDAKKVLKGEIDSPSGVDFGLICSFSLPIITICALIVLMIFVFLLNIVFWWVPFFRICFPLQLKASE